MARFCAVCGRHLERKLGRPSDYCSPAPGKERSDCARLQERFDEIRGYAARIAVSLGEDSASQREFSQKLMQLRGRLWSEANTATNIGRLWGRFGRKRYQKNRSGWWRASECDILPGMHTIRISCYEEARGAVLHAVLPLVRDGKSEVENGFLYVTGEVLVPEKLEEAARNAGAFSVVFQAAEAASEAPVVASPVAPLSLSAGLSESEPISFAVAFTDVDAGLAFTRNAAGRVSFSEPPTSWEGNHWCVHGTTAQPDEIGALARSHGGDVR